MNTKQKPVSLMASTAELNKASTEVAELERQAGMVGRLSAGWSTQRVAADALKDTRRSKINALRDIRATAIALTTSTVKAAMVAEAMPALGALTTQLNMATGSVDQALTNGAVAETYTHFTNRQQNLDLINALHGEGKITEEEAQLLREQIQSDSYTDIHRTRERTEMAKANVAAIHSHGVAAIQHAKDTL